jgi:DNA mismatch endonuclease (patch repair protein)
VDGCFWHRCPQHGTEPRSNTGYWGPKLDRNVERDRETDERARDSGGWEPSSACLSRQLRAVRFLLR